MGHRGWGCRRRRGQIYTRMPMHPAAASKMRNPDTNCEQYFVVVAWFYLVSIIQTVDLYLAYADSSHPKQHHQLKILMHVSLAENPESHVTS